jgi:hypothetical protein
LTRTSRKKATDYGSDRQNRMQTGLQKLMEENSTERRHGTLAFFPL